MSYLLEEHVGFSGPLISRKVKHATQVSFTYFAVQLGQKLAAAGRFYGRGEGLGDFDRWKLFVEACNTSCQWHVSNSSSSNTLLSLRLNVVTAAPVAEVVGRNQVNQIRSCPGEPHRECSQIKVLWTESQPHQGDQRIGASPHTSQSCGVWCMLEVVAFVLRRFGCVLPCLAGSCILMCCLPPNLWGFFLACKGLVP